MPRLKRTAPRREARLAEIGAIYAFALPLGRFGACQVVGAGDQPGNVEVVALDWDAPEPPGPERALGLEPLRRTWASWRGEPARSFVDARVPWWAERVARSRPPAFATRCASYARWEGVVLATHHRRLWEAGARRTWRHDPEPVRVDLGGGPVEVRRDCARATIGPGGMFPATRRPVFDALDALPCVTELEYAGGDEGFVEYLVARKLPSAVWTAHGQRTIDLRESRVEELTLDVGDGDVALLAPETLLTLTVRGDATRLSLEGVALDHPFLLRIEAPAVTAPPRGAEAVQCVEYAGLRDTDASALAAYDRLAELRMWGAPGRLRDARALASLSRLRELELYDLYDLDAARWPADWPTLDGARLQGLRKAEARAVKTSLVMVPDVRVGGARTDAWIAANLDCPFRDWEDDDEAFGRAACVAWRKAKAAAEARGVLAAATDSERILKGLVATLNRLDRKHGIDTHRREQAGGAFCGLARDLGISAEQAVIWFDAWRTF